MNSNKYFKGDHASYNGNHILPPPASIHTPHQPGTVQRTVQSETVHSMDQPGPAQISSIQPGTVQQYHSLFIKEGLKMKVGIDKKFLKILNFSHTQNIFLIKKMNKKSFWLL